MHEEWCGRVVVLHFVPDVYVSMFGSPSLPRVANGGNLAFPLRLNFESSLTPLS